MPDEPQGSNSRLRESLTSSRHNFYKAYYAIRCRNVRETKGMACAVYLDGQQKDKTRDSVLLLTWKGCIEETNDDLVMYRFSREHFGQYHLNSSRLFHDGNFSLIECNCSDDSKQSKDLWEVRLEIQCLKRKEQMKDFIVYTTNGVECLDLKLEYNKTTSNYDVIYNGHFDLKLCGAPIIDQNKIFVGVLMKDPDHPNKFIPCFISKEVLDRLKEKQKKAMAGAQETNREEPVADRGKQVGAALTPSSDREDTQMHKDVGGEMLADVAETEKRTERLVIDGPEGYAQNEMAEELEKLREEPKEKAPGGNIEQPIPKEDNRSFNFVFEFRQDEPDKTVVEFRCSGNGFTDSDWKDLSETTVKEGCMAVTKALEASGRQVVGVRPSESVLVELHCYTKESFVSLMDDFHSKKVKRRLEEEFGKVGYKGEMEVTIINEKDVYRALEQIRAQTAMTKGMGVVGEVPVTNADAIRSRSAPGTREPVPHEPIQETASDSSEELSASSRPVQESGQAGFPRDRSQLPQTVSHFVSRESECQSILTCLDPTHECRCVLLHGPPGIGKTALAIKVANDRLETDKNTMVVYVNCKYIRSPDDFAEKVLAQIYHYPSNNPISGLKTRLENSDSNKFTIILLDNFEFLIDVDDWIENQQREEPVDRIKAANFVERLISSSRNVKLLVTSSENVVFPTLGGEKITLTAFKPEQTFKLLKTVWKNRPVDKTWADQLSDFCSGIPLVLYTLISSQKDLESRLLQMEISPPEERFEFLKKIKVVPKEKKIDVCLDVCFKRLSPQKQNTLVSLTLLKGWFTPSGAAKVFQSTQSSERQLIDQVLELANCSFLVQNITAQGDRYSFLSLIREYCRRKEMDQRFSRVFHSARNQCIDFFLNFLKDTFKMFLSRNALQAITDFQREEENIMQLLEWLDNDQMDEERIMACIDVFNMVGELLAKMMSKRKFKSKYDLLKKKCEAKGDQQRLSECLTSLGIKEVFNCCCTPGLCDEASQRAKAYLEEADRIQNDLKITSGNSRAQCLAKLGRCLAQQRDPQGKPKIKEAIRTRLNDHSDEDICRVMLGATYNDMAVALSLEEDHRQAIKIREEKTLPIYKEKLGEHPFTATIYNNISNNFFALKKFDQAKPYSEHALKIRRKLLNDHMDTAKSLFDLGMVHKEQGDFQQAITYLEQSKNMQEKVQEDNLKDLQRTRQELEDVYTRLNGPGASQPPNVD